ncbi:MAG TPA: GNAT family N-acetyltransferase [Gaiellaceae bacterium]|nr:GNAT family N-acetyltransferase [Gaiellaceae bacterium]
MGVAVRAADEFSLAELAAAFTASYEGYFVPLEIDEAALRHMVEIFDLDPTQSLVAVDGGELVGLANLGRRGDRTWVGGVGVVAGRRGEGLGERLMRELLDRARQASARETALEVILENTPAIRLYEKLGFDTTRELDILSLPGDTAGGTAEDVPLDRARSTIASLRDEPEPWQRADESVENLVRHNRSPSALASDGGAAIYRADGGRITVLQMAGDEPALRELVATLRGKGAVSAGNFPSGGAVSAALRTAGAEVVVRQREMRLAL